MNCQRAVRASADLTAPSFRVVSALLGTQAFVTSRRLNTRSCWSFCKGAGDAVESSAR